MFFSQKIEKSIRKNKKNKKGLFTFFVLIRVESKQKKYFSKYFFTFFWFFSELLFFGENIDSSTFN